MHISYYFANTAEGSGDLFGSLGIDWKLFTIQLISFLILLAILKKLVFPVLFAALDKREKVLADSVKAAESARRAAEKAEANTEKQLEAAKKDAAAIVETASKEAARIIAEAEARAEKKADHAVAQAQARIESDVADARRALREEMVVLVADATEKIVRTKIDSKKDAELIRSALGTK